MRTEHYLFHVLGVTSKSRVKFVDSKRISADQRLCFRYTDSTIPLLPKYEISSL